MLWQLLKGISANGSQEEQTVRPVTEAINDVARALSSKGSQRAKMPEDIAYIDYVETPEEEGPHFERL